MEKQLEYLCRLINEIDVLYHNETAEWVKTQRQLPNLKKMTVADIESEGTLYENIFHYIGFLNSRSYLYELPTIEPGEYKLMARVKTSNSIDSKIQAYMSEAHAYGKVPVNKCVNDLYGLRVILPKTMTPEQLICFVTETYGNKYRCVDSSKGEYKAVHLYYKAGNTVFPWELQIWNQVDAAGNLHSHKLYKQDYTVWERESLKGGCVDG